MSPYRIDQPFVVSFSGGRTSAYMLRQILDAHGGAMPEQSAVLFANTGKERTETLDFVERCSLEWGVEIVWLEYRSVNDRHGFAAVNYATASRAGEPFDQCLAHKERYRAAKDCDPVLPNPVQRFCTADMKIRTMRRYLVSVRGWKSWQDAIGLRYDEPRRVARINEQRRERGDPVCPLHAAKVTEDDVMRFWAGQPFDLRLQQHEGNCDLCFLKSRDKIVRIMRDRPDLANWWAEREQHTGQRFRKDRPGYVELLDASKRPDLFTRVDDDVPDCRCTD